MHVATRSYLAVAECPVAYQQRAAHSCYIVGRASMLYCINHK